MLTSKTCEWETPQDLFDKLNEEFDFSIDVCANYKNKKVEDYIGKRENGLKVNWSDFIGWKWMNPPYGREIKEWIKKASEERKVVALIPARTDTKWFHEYIYNKQNVEIRFIKRRLKFGRSKTDAPFPSMIVIFK